MFDIQADLNISFEEAFEGCKKKFSVRIPGKDKADSLSLKIPAGCQDGTKMRLKGQGKPNGAGGNGDLIVVIHVLPHQHFIMDGKNVSLKVPVTFCEAALGAKIEIPTPEGKKIRISIPSGTKNGAKLTIKGKGVAGTGNLIANLELIVPKKMDGKQKKALENYSKIEDKGVRKW